MPNQPTTQVQKLVMLGLGEAGKSSIKSIVFDGKKTHDVSDYKATSNYIRTSNSFIGSTFSIFDCGGQEVFLTRYVGKLSEFIFSSVKVLVWVIDVGNFEGVSKSKYYFDLAMERLHQYSPEATVYCLFHKIDLLTPDKKTEVVETLKNFFTPFKSFETKYHATNIFDHSIFTAFSDIMGNFIRGSVTTRSIKETLTRFMQENAEILSGISLFTDKGFLVSGEGDMVEEQTAPANLWLTNADKMQKALGANSLVKGVFETEDSLFIFQKIKDGFLCAVKADKSAPIQYVLMKIDEMVDLVKDVLISA
ncbi:MAG: ADP-ribosylation factor-like protein [Candidatus Odinarchaeota archaeon]